MAVVAVAPPAAAAPKPLDSFTSKFAGRLEKRHKATKIAIALIVLLWAMMAWIIFTARCPAMLTLVAAPCLLEAFFGTRVLMCFCDSQYGSLIYTLLGPDAVTEYANTFGISVALKEVTRWADITKEAAQIIAAVLLLDWLNISTHESWLEARGLRVLVACVFVHHS